jgi:DNA polymerase-3 subunit beta
MKFVVSSSELLSHLQAISRVISSKNSLPILDNFLFDLKGNELQITASDLESTLITRLTLENVSAEGIIAIPAKLLSDTLKEFSEQPLSFDVNAETQMVVITSQNGRFSIPGQNGSDFPQIPQIREDKKASIQMAPGLLMSGITKAIFATADDELRPVMNGIYVELSPSDITFVASDAHKLVRYRRTDAQSEVSASFILSKKPASLLKNVLGKEENLVTLEFDDKNAFFTLTNYKMVCRLIEGTYPSFNAVIPQNNPNKVIVDRVELLNTLRRVSVYANQASNLIKLDIKNNEMMVSAQDIDFSISAYERIGCQYDGDEMEIGFKSSFLIEILANLASGDVVFELSDPARAGLVLPLEKEIEEEDVLMLLMPMMINA